jgi:hypothetical protein
MPPLAAKKKKGQEGSHFGCVINWLGGWILDRPRVELIPMSAKKALTLFYFVTSSIVRVD